jgi:aminopeptidase N
MAKSMQEDQNKPRQDQEQSHWLRIAILGTLACIGLAGISAAFLLLDNAGTVLPFQSANITTTTGQAPVVTSPSTKEATTESDQVSDELLAPQAGGSSAGDPYTPELGNTGYDVQHYLLQLALDPANDSINGTATIEAVSTVPGLAELSLDFAGFQVASVTIDGKSTNFVRDRRKLIMALPELKDTGQPFDIVVSYHGQPLYEPSAYLQMVDHLGLHYPDGETIFAVAEPDGARYWFPANDHPRDKATFRFEIVVPEGLTAVANGEFINREPAALPGGRDGELFVWEHQFPMAPYLALVAVGEYEKFGTQSPSGIPLRYYYFPGLAEEIRTATHAIPDAIDWMASLFGPYPFESFGYVTVKIPGASLETQTMVLLSSNMIGERTAIHELAHMWFGDWVSLHSWEEMWRNEGFATYVQLMWETGDDPEELALRIASLESIVEGNDKDYPLHHPPPHYLFDLNVYFEGAVAVHALRAEMGDDAFFRGLRAYFQLYGGGTASDAEFRAVMEEAAGRSLESYFSQWFPTNQ